jgi:hypothetical protein
MSLELAAQHLASRGRKGDTMLVHMAPEEVSGLQALAKAGGGTLSLNPDTGLPEANFLKRMLPMVIGAGLSAASGGALTPMMAAMMTGGGYGVATGDLRKGLMAGLGAYGGAGLAGSLMGAGATPLAGMETAALENPAVASLNTPNLAGAGAGAGAGSGVVVNPVPLTPSAEIMGAVPGGPSLAQSLNVQAQQAAEQAARAAAGPVPQVATSTPLPPAPSTFSQNMSQMGRGLSEVGKDPSRFMTKDNLKYGLSALAPAMMGGEPEQYKGSGPNPFRYRYEQTMPEGPNTEGSSEALQYQGRYVPYANGGPIEEMSMQNRAETMMANGGQMFARGGISHLGDYSDGGRLLKGPGDGVSDSIPATIANKRPARLADGEFVVPARIVSELGNGSTEAGARKLYAMMDRVQKARKKSIGKNKVAVNSRAAKLLPA